MAPLAAAAWLLAAAALWHLLGFVRRTAACLACAGRLPGPAARSWLLGNAPDILSDPPHQFRRFQEWDAAHGPVYATRFLVSSLVVVSDPDLFGPLLRPGRAHLEKHLATYERFQHFVHPPTPSMLTRPEDATWRLVRRGVAPAFQTANLRSAFPAITAAIGRSVDALEGCAGRALEFDDLAQRTTIDVIGAFGFGRDLSAHRVGPRLELVDAARRDLRKWGSWLRRAVEALLADAEANPPPPYTLAAHVLAIRDDKGRPLPRHLMISELTLLFSAGYETTAHSLTWALFLIATHPAVEAALLEELGDLAAGPGRTQPRPLAWGDLGRLRRLSAVIQEAMRLYPAVSTGTVRITDGPLTLGGFTLCGGMPVLIPTWAVHRSPRLWLRPDEFLPFERWLGGDGDTISGDKANDDGGGARSPCSPRSGGGSTGGTGCAGAGPASPNGSGPLPSIVAPAAFMAFSQGTRSCVGQGLAVAELKAALALLLGRFAFELAPGVDAAAVAASAAQAVTLRPCDGLWLGIGVSDWTWWPTIDKYKIPPQIIITDYSTPWDSSWSDSDAASLSWGSKYFQAHHVAIYLSLDPGYPGLATAGPPPPVTEYVPVPSPPGRDPAAELVCKGGKVKFSGKRTKAGVKVGVMVPRAAGKYYTFAGVAGAKPPVIAADFDAVTKRVLLVPLPPSAQAQKKEKKEKPHLLLAHVIAYARNGSLACELMLPLCVDGQGRLKGLGACAALTGTSMMERAAPYIMSSCPGLLAAAAATAGGAGAL
ncbi:MAG: cytochrome P450 [Monoraphidium minutum]|nr:MAG: cytochrome P450 [Monoraphidium minutum]